MSAVDNVVPLPVRIKLMCSSCGSPGEGSCHCGASYVPWKDKAAADAIAKDPAKSDRVIAAEIGVSRETVRKARKPTDNRLSVEKRTGKDGKTRKMPKRRTAKTKFEAAVQARQRGKSQTEAAKEAGLNSVQTVKIAEGYEEGGAEVLEQLGVDPDTLAPSAKAKLETAKRMMQKEFDLKFAERMRGVDEEVRQRVLAATKERLAMLKEREDDVEREERYYRDLLNNNKPIFTMDEYKLIVKCIHPNGRPDEKTLNAGSDLITSRKFQLTGKK